MKDDEIAQHRYTLTYNEGTVSIYAAFSRLKHLVVQIVQMSF